jgi:hypothetical protein
MGPVTSLRYPFKVTRGLLYIKPPMHFDIYGPVHNAFDFQGPTTSQEMDAARIKSITYAQGRINHRVHRWFYVQKLTGDFKGVS